MSSVLNLRKYQEYSEAGICHRASPLLIIGAARGGNDVQVASAGRPGRPAVLPVVLGFSV